MRWIGWRRRASAAARASSGCHATRRWRADRRSPSSGSRASISAIDSARRRAASRQPAGEREPDRTGADDRHVDIEVHDRLAGCRSPSTGTSFIAVSVLASAVSARASLHQRFDLVGVDRHVARHQLAAGRRDDRVVLDADADIPVALGHVFGRRGYTDPARWSASCPPATCATARALLVARRAAFAIVAGIVHVHAEPVARAVHVEARDRRARRSRRRRWQTSSRSMMPVSSKPCDSTRTAASCGASKLAPARVASMAACCAASTMSYSSRCAGVKRPLAGNVRVMSDA